MSSIRPVVSMFARLERHLNKRGERFLNPLRRKTSLYFLMLCLVGWEFSDGIEALMEDEHWELKDWGAWAVAFWLMIEHLVEYGSKLPHHVHRSWRLMKRCARRFWEAFIRWQIHWFEIRIRQMPSGYGI
jgi:hypothetical protein